MNKGLISKGKIFLLIGVLFVIGIVAGVFIANRNLIRTEVGASSGEIALESFKSVAGDSYVEKLPNLKDAKASGDVLKFLRENSTYVLDEEAIEIYVESYITAAESTAQATGVSLDELIVDTWGYESIDAYREAAKELTDTFIKERLAVYTIAKDKNIKISEDEYKESLNTYAINFGYATAEEFVYACMPVSIANEMLYDKVVQNEF